jgi:hypothetical protein
MDARHMKAAVSAMPVKTDRIDARNIACAMQVGWYRAVHLKRPEARKLRLLLSSRQMLLPDGPESGRAYDAVDEGADALDRDRDLVACVDRADTHGRAGGDDVARLEGHDRRGRLDQGRDVEDQVAGGGTPGSG